MSSSTPAWSTEQKTEAAILQAVAIVVALKQKLRSDDITSVPSLSEFIDLAQAVAHEIGWGDRNT